ncbi:MAG TPA: hypothetical protein VFY71_16840 [Planctomycetota bacterium]|nr:hypothetical protein [Planctomycetota bacterium]
MKVSGKSLWASPMGAAGLSLMLAMSAVMMAESFGSSRPTPGAVKVVVVALEFVGVGMALIATLRMRRLSGSKP